MKRMSKITTLLLALVMVLAMSQATFAADGTFTFNGSEIEESDLNYSLSNMQPGDEMELTFVYSNASTEETDWYLSNEILETLEENGKASGGGYTYRLTNYGKSTGELDIYDSDAVGGQGSAVAEGLKQVNLGIEGDGSEEYIYIDTLQPGEAGSTVLYVALDGESQANNYENAEGELKVSYGVQVVGQEDVYKHVNVKTGDDTNIFGPAAIFIGALLLLIALLSFRKDRKDGEDA